MYKNKISGVYAIRCHINGKLYVGSSVHIKNRIRHHKDNLQKFRKGANPNLLEDWHKYGGDKFEFFILSECSNIREMEQKFIDLMEPEYNIYGSKENIKKRPAYEDRGKHLAGKRGRLSKLSDEQVRDIRKLLEDGRLTLREIAELFDVAHNSITQIKKGISYKHVT